MDAPASGYPELEVPCDRCGGTGRVPDERYKRADKACGACLYGLVLTPFGEEVMECVKRRLKIDMRFGDHL